MITMKDALPSVTTNRIYNVGGALFFNGLSLATGSSISGTTGTVPKFTAATTLGDSNATISGNNWTFASATLTATAFVGSGAGLTSIPTSAVSSGNFVATVASGTGITSSVTSGNAAATAISLNNTAVTPSTYGSSTAISQFTVDQQGRITSATTVTPQLTLTSTYFSSLSGTALTGVALLGSVNTFTAFGTHTWTAGSNGAQEIALTNTTSGTAGRVQHVLTAGTSSGVLATYSQGFTTGSVYDIASSTALASSTSGGLSVSANSGPFRIWTGAAGTPSLRWGVNTAGDWTFGASANIADSNGAPSVTSGGGAGASVSGTDYAFSYFSGSSGSTSGVVTFGHTFANAPVCVAVKQDAIGAATVTVQTTVTTVTLNYTSATATSIFVLCRGY